MDLLSHINISILWCSGTVSDYTSEECELSLIGSCLSPRQAICLVGCMPLGMLWGEKTWVHITAPSLSSPIPLGNYIPSLNLDSLVIKVKL